MKEKRTMALSSRWYFYVTIELRNSQVPGPPATPTIKLFIYKSKTAGASQVELARKMSKSRATAQRAFYTAQKAGVVANKRIRTGKGKTDQYNEYSIVWGKTPRVGHASS